MVEIKRSGKKAQHQKRRPSTYVGRPNNGVDCAEYGVKSRYMKLGMHHGERPHNAGREDRLVAILP